MHIGIVACSAEGAALCYRTICAEASARADGYGHPQISLHGHSLQDYVDAVAGADWERVAELMLSSADKLAATGADFLICPDNTIHNALPRAIEHSPLPWLSIVDAVVEKARASGMKKLGLTGTAWLVESELYPLALASAGMSCKRPSASDIRLLDRSIMDELVHGQFTRSARSGLLGVVTEFAEAGCDGVILGCTELPLIAGFDLPLPTLDTTRILARAAIARAADPRHRTPSP